MKTTKSIVVFVVLAILGFIDAAYLAAKFYTNTIPDCSFLKGCETVTTSSYATVFGLSIALLGAIYYGLLLLLVLISLDTGQRKWFRWAGYLTIAGFLESIYLVTIQIFSLKAICIYCMFSAGMAISLFIIAVISFNIFKR